jgi:TolB protein
MTTTLSKVLMLTLLILLVAVYGLQDSNEVQITTHPANQMQPAVYRDTVVWADERNGNLDIYGYNLSTHEEFQITRSPLPEFRPDIYGDIVVWVEAEAQDSWHISACYLSTGETICLTPEKTICENPAICGTVVVWEEAKYNARNIRGYDFSTSTYLEITDDKNFQINPAIGESIIVWEGHERLSGDIYGLNLENHHRFQIAQEGLSNSRLAVWDTIVVWEGRGTINWIDLKTGKKTRIESPSVKQCPQIHDTIIVWEDYRNKNADIYGYDLAKQKEFLISGHGFSQKNPDVFGDIVVWEDERNGNLDIYCCSLPIRILSTEYVVLIAGLAVLLIIVLIRKEK